MPGQWACFGVPGDAMVSGTVTGNLMDLGYEYVLLPVYVLIPWHVRVPRHMLVPGHVLVGHPQPGVHHPKRVRQHNIHTS